MLTDNPVSDPPALELALAHERHYTHRIGWLRAAVLGANDGIVSTGSIVVGVAAAESAHSAVLLAGMAGLAAGAMAMAAGEYVSVSSQADTEAADLERERRELAEEPERELRELQGFYIRRGLDEALALQVAQQMTAHDALGAHAREELGLSDVHTARPVQAAVASAGTFSGGAALPLLVAAVTPVHLLLVAVPLSALLFLAVLGAISAGVGGSSPWRAAARVTFWGAFAMAITALVGRLFGAVV